MSNYLDTFIKNVEELLQGRGQKWLCKETGINKSNISRYLSKESTIPLEAAYKIADALECSIDDLIGKSVPKDDLIKKIGELTMELERIKNHPALVAYEKGTPSQRISALNALAGGSRDQAVAKALDIAREALRPKAKNKKDIL